MTHDGDDATTDSKTPVDSASENSGNRSRNDLDLEQRLERLWQVDTPLSRSTGSSKKELLHGYTIRKVLGGGAFGIVYLADDLEHDREVALKVPRPEVLLDEENRQRFANEAMLAAKLKHQGIVEVFQTELIGPTPFIAAAYCQGPDLAQWLADQTEPPPWRECVELLVQICDAVEYAHQHGVYHRDLKPANIMLAGEAATDSTVPLNRMKPKITDFGLAKLVDPTLTNTRSSLLIGTPMYMAPEQMESGSSNGAATIDVYALGVILFELLTGQYPVQGNSYFEVLDNIRAMPATRLRTIRRDLPKSLDRICSICLQNNPQARYSSAADLSADLRKCLDGQTVAGKRNGMLSRVGYWCTRPKRLATAGWFMVVNEAIAMAWVLITVAFSVFYGVVTWDEYPVVWLHAILVTLGFLAVSWAGWQMIGGARWAAWVGVAISLIKTPAIVIAIVYQPMLFKSLYLGFDPFFSFTVHSMLLICNVIQLFLLICAIVAGRTKRAAEARK